MCLQSLHAACTASMRDCMCSKLAGEAALLSHHLDNFGFCCITHVRWLAQSEEPGSSVRKMRDKWQHAILRPLAAGDVHLRARLLGTASTDVFAGLDHGVKETSPSPLLARLAQALHAGGIPKDQKLLLEAASWFRSVKGHTCAAFVPCKPMHI